MQENALKLVLLLKDGNPANDADCDGIAHWLAETEGAEILETKIPDLAGVQKTKAMNAAKNLVFGNRRDAREWLALANGDMLVRQVGQWFAERNVREGSSDVLILSSGSASAPYNLAMGYIWRCCSATSGIPEVVGTDPFDFAIVHELEFPERKANIFVTSGPLNSITEEKIKLAGESFLAEYPTVRERIWSLIIGGNNREYRISAEWIKKNVGSLAQIAEKEKADLFILLMGKIDSEASKALKNIEAHSSANIRLFTKEENNYDPRTGMYGVSEKIFCTEDQQETIFEALASGIKPVLLKTGYKKGFQMKLQELTERLVQTGALSVRALWGAKKRNLTIDNLIRKNYVTEFKYWKSPICREERDENGDTLEKPFNEAQNAAAWIAGKIRTFR